MAYSIKVGRAQYIGARGEQEDCCGISSMEDMGFIHHGGILAVVADGIGGHAHGGDASELAVQAFIQAYKGKSRQAEIPDALYSALKKANAAVCEFAEIQGALENCGTTLVAVVLHPKSQTFHWISVGDSRLYLLRDEALTQLTMDGNYAHRLTKKIARGILSEEERDLNGNPEVITSFIGVARLTDIDRSIRPFPLHVGDRLVLCTDGIFKSLNKHEMLENLRNGPQAACDSLLRTIAAKGYKNQDNCTVAVLGYELAETSGPAQESPATKADQLRKTPWTLPQKIGLGIALILTAALLLTGIWLVK